MSKLLFYILFLNSFFLNLTSGNDVYNSYSSYSSTSCITTWKNTFKISDAGNVKDSLIFGMSPNGTSGIDTCLGERSLPPVPPGGAFDARFIVPGDYSKVDIRKDSMTDVIWTAQFQPSPSGYPITFTWNNTSFPSTGFFYLKDNIGGSLVNINMRNQSSYTLTNSGIGTLRIEYTGIKVNLKVIPEGFYFPLFNQLSRRDTFSIFLRNAAPPYAMSDSSRGVIDSITFIKTFVFPKSSAGSYYIVVKHLNSIETWSISGIINVPIIGFDFTTSQSQAYGNNLQLKSGKYCLYGGDVDQNGYIDLTDLIKVFNDSRNFLIGRYLPADLTGDSIIDLTDITLCYNNSINFIVIRRP